ncbi:hypothetical protein OSTOST_16138 [Ostertagia ostertagi]
MRLATDCSILLISGISRRPTTKFFRSRSSLVERILHKGLIYY